MLSVHYNGDIVKHPDTAKLYRERVEKYDAEGRCKFGVRECYCPVYMDQIKKSKQVKRFELFARCMLFRTKLNKKTFPVSPRPDNYKLIYDTSGRINKFIGPVIRVKVKKFRNIRRYRVKPLLFFDKPICPIRKKLQERGNTKKMYRIDQRTYRKVASAGHNLIRNAKNRAIFITLSLPPFKPGAIVTENILNEKFSKFIENLRRSEIYSAGAYVAVKERGERFGRTHWHIIIDMRFVSFITLNRYWCSVISDICVFSGNAVRTKRNKAILYDFVGALRYVCKYFSKSRNDESETRNVFISHDALRNPEQLKHCTIESVLYGYKSIYIRTYDYSTVYTVTDKDQFRKFCWKFIYPLFADDVRERSGLQIADPKPG